MLISEKMMLWYQCVQRYSPVRDKMLQFEKKPEKDGKRCFNYGSKDGGDYKFKD